MNLEHLKKSNIYSTEVAKKEKYYIFRLYFEPTSYYKKHCEKNPEYRVIFSGTTRTEQIDLNRAIGIVVYVSGNIEEALKEISTVITKNSNKFFLKEIKNITE